MRDYDAKPKRKNNDYDVLFQNSYPEYYDDKKERGGCLSIFLILQFAYSGLMLFYAFSIMANRIPYRFESNFGSNIDIAYFGFSLAVVSGVRLVLLFATWKWIKWGYFGLLVVYALAIIASIFIQSILTIIFGLIEVSIFFALIKGKIAYFD